MENKNEKALFIKAKIERLKKVSDQRSKLLRATRYLQGKGQATHQDVLRAYNDLRNTDAELERLLAENP